MILMVDIIEDYGRTIITHDYKRFWIGKSVTLHSYESLGGLMAFDQLKMMPHPQQ